MARIYDVVCNSCGSKWGWCKYDRPDKNCPECGEELTKVVLPYFAFDGFECDYDYDHEKVKVIGP